ncbi:hypothetical protein F4818DRAFT_160402 [Hypoxylon cercidicola]|nr:hypothetical protein F4818DRAFT_160402 [Hypoxylon cercidicola]
MAFGLVTTKAAEQLSQLCVKVLLPCLLMVKLGSELHLDTAFGLLFYCNIHLHWKGSSVVLPATGMGSPCYRI